MNIRGAELIQSGVEALAAQASNVGAMPREALPQGTDQTRHRLEAFSDIVIALALSQLAFTLRIPDNSHEVLAHPVHLVTFLASFVFICFLWWVHHQLFARYFIPDAVSVILNFAFLAAVIFVAYALQLVFKFGDTLALATYALSLGCAFSLLGALFAKGTRDPRLTLDDTARRQGMGRTRRLLVIGGGFLTSVVVAAFGGSEMAIAATWLITFVALALLRVADRGARAGGPEARS